MNMDEKKIPILLGNQKLFDILSEVVIQINKENRFKFKTIFYDQVIELSNSTIIADKIALELIQGSDWASNIKKIYLITDELNNISEYKSQIVLVNMPIRLYEFFEQVSNDVSQELENIGRIINFNKFNYNFGERLLFNQDKKLRFTEKENEIFSCLLNHHNMPVSKKQLLKGVWEYDDTIDTHTLETHIYALRKKFEAELGLKNFLIHLDEGYQLDTSLL
mgnify:CR=1 FL=1